jgi:hypothetical protein
MTAIQGTQTAGFLQNSTTVRFYGFMPRRHRELSRRHTLA